MSDINDAPDMVERVLGSSLRRRDFLTKAAAAGAIVWTTPMILSRSAHALDGGGTPNCRPPIPPPVCVVHDCGQGNKKFPGITVTPGATPGGTCPCPRTTPAEKPITCIKITDLAATCDPDITAYGNNATCDPPAKPNERLDTEDWECFDPNFPVFFGRARSGGGSGAIPALPSDCTITFKLGVWAGGCPDRDSTDDAFTCRTFDVTIVWDQGTKTIDSCTVTADPANTLCTEAGETPPGGCSPCPPA